MKRKFVEHAVRKVPDFFSKIIKRGLLSTLNFFKDMQELLVNIKLHVLFFKKKNVHFKIIK